MRRTLVALFMVSLLAACTKESAVETAEKISEKTENAVDRVQETFDAAVPIREQRPTREELERERFNEEWRRVQTIQSAQRKRAAAARPRPVAIANVTFVQDPKFQENLKTANFQAIDTLPLRVPVKGDVGGPSVLRAQVVLDRLNFSVGAIDGRWGKNSSIAVYWFQEGNDLDTTGDIDEETFRTLLQAAGNQPTLRRYALTADDIKGPYTAIPEDVYDKEKLDCLCYESKLEAMAEKFHSATDLLTTLNPGIDFGNLREGQEILVPNVRMPVSEQAPDDIAKIVISVRGWYLHGLDAGGRIVFHAPTTLGSEYDPSPDETLKIVKTAHNPQFHYQPKLFHEIDDEEPEAHLKPGPNSPVGVVWMALSKKHFGIHGTSDPETIGYASSHGCVRLANWDARDLSYRVPEGVTVAFVDTRGAGAVAKKE